MRLTEQTAAQHWVILHKLQSVYSLYIENGGDSGYAVPIYFDRNKGGSMKKTVAAAALIAALLTVCTGCTADISSLIPTSEPVVITGEPLLAPTPTAEPAPTPVVSEVGIDIPSGEWTTILVGPQHMLPDDFDVQLAQVGGKQLDARIVDVVEKMLSDAELDGIYLHCQSAYRDFDYQKKLFDRKIEKLLEKGVPKDAVEDEAARVVARPGTSEHHTGLAIDFLCSDYSHLDEGFADTAAFLWLTENAHKYGFIMRYAANKADITQIIYEPWHWRFVGLDAAYAMHASGECLEEYLGL